MTLSTLRKTQIGFNWRVSEAIVERFILQSFTLVGGSRPNLRMPEKVDLISAMLEYPAPTTMVKRY